MTVRRRAADVLTDVRPRGRPHPAAQWAAFLHGPAMIDWDDPKYLLELRRTPRVAAFFDFIVDEIETLRSSLSG